METPIGLSVSHFFSSFILMTIIISVSTNRRFLLIHPFWSIRGFWSIYIHFPHTVLYPLLGHPVYTNSTVTTIFPFWSKRPLYTINQTIDQKVHYFHIFFISLQAISDVYNIPHTTHTLYSEQRIRRKPFSGTKTLL